MMKDVQITLRDHIAPLVTAMGYEFVGCEIQQAVLRVYVDTEQGITLEDCSKISRQVNAMLTVLDPIRGNYTLEISSPGLDRPLFELTHYQKQIGQCVKVRLYTPLHNRRKFVGKLLRVEGNEIHLLVDEQEVVLPFSEIEKANVVADIR